MNEEEEQCNVLITALNKAVDAKDAEAVQTITKLLNLVDKNVRARVTNPIRPEIKAILDERIYDWLNHTDLSKVKAEFQTREAQNLVDLIDLAQIGLKEATALLKPYMQHLVCHCPSTEALKILEPYMH